jgi:DNA replication protein DnaC
MNAQLQNYISKLQLYGMRSTIDVRLKEATNSGLSHSDFLTELLHDESSFREKRRIDYRIRRAKFRQDAHLDLYDNSVKRSITKPQLKELLSLDFLEKSQSIILSGPTGVGKTFIASAIGRQACERGHDCIFIGMNSFVEQGNSTRASGHYLRHREKLITTKLLIIDDFGLISLMAQNVQDLYDVLEERYQKKSTIITTQLPIENWKEVITDTVSLDAILDRLVHGIRIEIKGESYRKKQGIDKVMRASGN